ncbi:Transglycosylase-like domain protein [Gleimia coleocanis DSM 15436]|uniref:Transglycosylase-like domain protein n=1 Tax=Gleimia coleocanis DSM 15436 TaxID=525245 RepID=C0W0Y1_9ACTO|nr:resuscitation-promoting factor [Gleimia coleocanis]EEH63705.1 Transglycosylase-like domain protein [Gleimia coleocanis DSM 15436]
MQPESAETMEMNTESVVVAAAKTAVKDKGRKLIAGIASGVLMLASVVTVGIYWARDTYTIQDEGKTQQVTTWQGTVADALEAANIKLGKYDEVTPKLDAELADGASIRIKRAKEYTVFENDQTVKVWSTAGSLEEVLSTIEDTGRDVSLPASRSSERGELQPLSRNAAKIQVKADGKAVEVEATAADNVATLLEKAKVTASGIDAVVVDKIDGKLQIEVIRVKRGNVVEEKELPFETQVKETDQLFKGEERVVAEGAKGLEKTTYYRHTRGDKVLVNKEISKVVAKAPQTRVIEKGTKERPKVEAPQQSANPNQPAPAPVATGDVWAALAQCESGGNPATNTGNGYYGMYQFSLPTWRAVGGSGLPSENSAAEQTLRAQILQQRAGWGQWPHCARQLGLL